MHEDEVPEPRSLIDRLIDLALQKPMPAPVPESIPAGESLDTITVPDLSGPELIAEAKKALDLTYLDPDYAKYDFLRDERGKMYEVMVWKPGRDAVHGTEVRAYFKERGFHGNPVAFIAWATKHNPEGYHATISEDERLFRDAVGFLYAPRFVRGDGLRKLYLSLGNDVRYPWNGHWAFVAFREIHS